MAELLTDERTRRQRTSSLGVESEGSDGAGRRGSGEGDTHPTPEVAALMRELLELGNRRGGARDSLGGRGALGPGGGSQTHASTRGGERHGTETGIKTGLETGTGFSAFAGARLPGSRGLPAARAAAWRHTRATLRQGSCRACWRWGRRLGFPRSGRRR